MPSINANARDKERFDEFAAEYDTHAEAFAAVMDIVDAYNGDPVDESELADRLAERLAPKMELGAYRGAEEALEDTST